MAAQVAREEIAQEVASSYYFYLTSEEFKDTHFGYVTYSIQEEIAYVESIYLEQNYRRLGLGQATLIGLEEKLRGEVSVIRLYVFAHNKAAFNLYKKMGYVIESTYFDKERLIGYHMEKAIAKADDLAI